MLSCPYERHENGGNLAQSLAANSSSAADMKCAGYMLHMALIQIARDLTRRSKMLQSFGCT